MSDIIYGQPATIQGAPMPPAAVNIVSSTNASPTVITATAHGLQTGQAVIISGHLVNTNANGVRIATVLDADTFKISTFAGFLTPTYINGNGVGGATGTIQSLAFPGFTVPEDLSDDMDASSVNVGFEALADMTAWLASQQLNAAPCVSGVPDLPNTSAPVDSSFVEQRVPGVLAADRDYTLISTAGGQIPTDGRRVRLGRYGVIITNKANIKREDGTLLVSLDAGSPSWADVVFRTSDGEWHTSAFGGNCTVTAVD